MKNRLSRICLLVGLIISLGVFFCADVFAANTAVKVSKYAHDNQSSVNFNVRATQFYPISEGTTSLDGGSTCTVYVFAELQNSSSTLDAKVTNAYMNYTFSAGVYIHDIEIMAGELGINFASSNFILTPSEQFADGSSIIVPRGKSVSVIYKFKIDAYFDVSSMSYTFAELTTITLSTIQVTQGDYPVDGDSVDLSIIESYLSDIDYNTDDIESQITSLINVVSYTGTGYTYDYSDYVSSIITGTDDNYDFNISVERRIYPLSLNNVDIELNSSSDILVQTTT